MAKEKVKKPFYKKIWFWIIAAIIVIAAVGGGGEESTDTTQTTSGEVTSDQGQEETNSSDAVEEVEKVAEEVTAVKVGEPATVGDVTFTVTGIEETNEISSGNEFIENATTSGKFIIVDVAVKNDKSEAITMNSSHFKLVSGSTEYEPSTDGTVAMAMGADNQFFLEQINPGLEKAGKIVFEVGSDVDVAASILRAQTGFWGTETIEISLAQ